MLPSTLLWSTTVNQKLRLWIRELSGLHSVGESIKCEINSQLLQQREPKQEKKKQKIKKICPVHQHAPICQFTGLLGFKHHISGRENTPLTAQGLQTLAGIANQTNSSFFNWVIVTALIILSNTSTNHPFAQNEKGPANFNCWSRKTRL